MLMDALHFPNACVYCGLIEVDLWLRLHYIQFMGLVEFILPHTKCFGNCGCQHAQDRHG